MATEAASVGETLKGRAVVVTGANGGIGLAIAQAVAAAGAHVAVWGRNESKNASAIETLQRDGRRAIAVRCDVTSESDVQTAFDASIDAFGKVDVLFANAGVARWFTPFVDVTLEQWREAMSVNLDGAFLCLRTAARHLVDRGEGGALVSVSSLAALTGAPRGEDYAAAKAGLIAMTQGLAVELARYRVRANSLVLGWVETAMNQPVRERAGMMEATAARSPLRRWLDPAEVGPAAVFLADPANIAHTGDTVVVDGAYRLA